MSKKIPPLAPNALSTRCNPRQFNFATTQGLTSEEDLIGQERAIEALEYGLNINHKGYNIYVMGPPGLGKHVLAKELVIRKSRLQQTATDWCYVFNFSDPLRPRALQLSSGKGQELRHDMDELIEKLHTNFSETSAQNIIHSLQKKYMEYPAVVDHLESALKNIIKSAKEFISRPRESVTLFDQPYIETPPFSRLKVNLFVDSSRTIGSPVIYEDNPIYHNLTGRVENLSINGSLISDFTLIRPGSLHRANNGYLILNIFEVLTHHLAWEGLKRALHTKEVRIQPLEQSIEFWSSQTLEPEPIPLNIKIILIGDRDTYYTLSEGEPDFKELFKVIADFENEMPRNKKNHYRYAKMIGSMTIDEKLKPLDRNAVCRVIDYSSRLIEDSLRLSTDIHSIKSLIQEADYWAQLENRTVIMKDDIEKSIKKRIHRINRVEQKIYEEIQRDLVMIDTSGKKIGQINALTIIELGEHAFGQPSKITVSIHVGDGDIIDIHREVDMTGSFYSKGVLTLTGFLKGRYARSAKLSLSASISFEQIYTSIHGDSASAAELCALLSALSDAPIRQSIAITGSINQFGELQAISSVNEKIEGFFAVCKERQFTGDQGVIIPKVNIQNLMLNDEVIKAVRNEKFHVYAVDTIDEAMHILTDFPAGHRDIKGLFPKNTINYKVEYRLKNYAKLALKNK